MKNCIVIVLAAISCVYASFAASSKGANLLNLLGRYKNAYTQLGTIDHADFGKALQEGQRLGLEMQQYDQALSDAKLPKYNPYVDTPESYISRLSEK